MRYLSEQWITAADAAVQSAASTAPAGRLVIDQIIEDTISYRVTIQRDESSVQSFGADAPAGQADATFVQNAATAADVAQGNTDAHQAFLLGRIRFDGDVNVLIARRDAFAWLQETLAPLLVSTTFTD